MDVTIDSKVIGQRLQKIRKSKGLTQAEMATHLNLQTSSYGNFERGSEMPSLKKVIQCCVILGVSPDALLGDCCIGLARQHVQQLEPQAGAAYAVRIKKEWIKQLDAEKEHVIKILFGR